MATGTLAGPPYSGTNSGVHSGAYPAGGPGAGPAAATGPEGASASASTSSSWGPSAGAAMTIPAEPVAATATAAAAPSSVSTAAASFASPSSPKAAALTAICGAAAMIGSRPYMEDTFCIIDDLQAGLPSRTPTRMTLLAVFDGHGGAGCAVFASKRFASLIVSSKYFPTNPGKALGSAILHLEHQWYDIVSQPQRITDRSGCCVAAVIVCGATAFVAHVGDCRVAIGRHNGTMEPLTADHVPANPAERQRLLAAGVEMRRHTLMQGMCCWVRPVEVGPIRVYPGGLAVSRAVGDFQVKSRCPGIICMPEIVEVPLDSNDAFIIVASDGVWDNMVPGTELAKVVMNSPEGRRDWAVRRSAAQDAAIRVMEYNRSNCRAPHLQDNATALIALLVPVGSVAASDPVPQMMLPVQPQHANAESGESASSSQSAGSGDDMGDAAEKQAAKDRAEKRVTQVVAVESGELPPLAIPPQRRAARSAAVVPQRPVTSTALDMSMDE